MNGSPLSVLVADSLDLEELAPLEKAGIQVLDRRGIPAAELPGVLSGCQGLLVRSRTKVTKELVEACPGLRVVGRAGSGVDNIDTAAATAAGVVVMNTPGGNTLAAAEHTIALLCAVARNLSQAAASLRSGAWKPADFLGVELTGKLLGVVGLGRIGREVARRGQGLGMEVLGFDPLMPPETAETLDINLVSLEELAERVDFLTVHVPLVEGTRGLVGASLLARVRPGIRILNVARGGIVDEAALLLALEDGRVAGAGLDVFEKEPPDPAGLIAHPRVVATPHLGASTVEAQRGVARKIAEQVAAYLTTGVVQNAVNMVGLDPADAARLVPWTELCRRLGTTATGLFPDGAESVELSYFGEIGTGPCELLTAAVLEGLLKPYVGERLNLVNAAHVAADRGLAVSANSRPRHKSFHSLVRLRVRKGESHLTLGGTLFGKGQLRVVRAFGLNIDAIPEGPILYVGNEDRPGVIGHLGTTLSEAGVNIANMSVGRDREQGRALAVLNLDQAPDPACLKRLTAAPGIQFVKTVTLPR